MKRALILLSVLLLVLSCDKKEPEYKGSPAIRLSVLEVSHGRAEIQVESLYAEAVYLSCSMEAETPPAAQLIAEGTKAEGGSVVFSGLSSGTRHYIFGVGVGKEGEYSKIEKTEFTTTVEAGDLYSWEKNRDGAPFISDISLCPGGGRPNSNAWFSIPERWDKDRFAPHVSFSDEDGEHWLFQSFLAITGIDMDGRNYGINNNGQLSADKASWEALLDYWMAPGPKEIFYLL